MGLSNSLDALFAQEERALRSRKGYVTIDTKQNGVRFRSSELLSANASYLNARKGYEDAQENIAKMIVEIAGSVFPGARHKAKLFFLFSLFPPLGRSLMTSLVVRVVSAE